MTEILSELPAIISPYEDGRAVIARDLFSGMGGWSLAASRLGFDSAGVELWEPARLTREAAGFPTVAHDVREFESASGDYDLLIGSPPCQTFSRTGNGKGRRALLAVQEGIRRFAAGETPSFEELEALIGDDRTALVLEPLRHALAAQPDFIAWEQVVDVRPVWEACAEVLRAHGYRAWVGVMKAEEYGVPQTRRRAVLLATRFGTHDPVPLPTHAAYRATDLTIFPPPVGMGAALGMPDDGTRQRSNYSAPGKPGQTAAERGRTMRGLAEPSVTITGRSFQWESPYGARRRSSVEDALVLQSFPRDFPIQGERGDILRLQVGNAVPPLMAEAALRAVIGASRAEELVPAA